MNLWSETQAKEHLLTNWRNVYILWKSIHLFLISFLAQHLQKYRAPLSHRETSVSCSSWCHLPCVDHKVLGNHFHTRPVSVVFLLSRWINRSDLEIKACFSTTHCSHPGGNNGCQSSHPSIIKSSQALAVNQSSGTITLAERYNWSTLCTKDSASKLNQAKTSRNVSVLTMCRRLPSLLCSKLYAVIAVS